MKLSTFWETLIGATAGALIGGLVTIGVLMLLRGTPAPRTGLPPTVRVYETFPQINWDAIDAGEMDKVK